MAGVDKNYPDLETVIALSDLYQLSLDILLKEDQNVVKGIEKTMNKKMWGKIFYSITGVSILLCLIINFALNQNLTWSLIVLLSLISIDALVYLFGKRNLWSPIVLVGGGSFLIIAFSGLLDRVLLVSNYINQSFFLLTALPISLIWLSLLWIVTVVQLRMRWSIFYSVSLFFLLGIIGGFLTNLLVSSEPLWFSVLISAIPCLFLGILFSFLGNYSANSREL